MSSQTHRDGMKDAEKVKCQTTFAEANTIRENDFQLWDCHNFSRNALIKTEERIALAKPF